MPGKHSSRPDELSVARTTAPSKSSMRIPSPRTFSRLTLLLLAVCPKVVTSLSAVKTCCLPVLLTRTWPVFVVCFDSRSEHVDGCCVLRLDEAAATQLFDILGEWLG